MTLELLFNVVLLVFFVFCNISISGVVRPENSDPMGPALWPQIILTLLILMFLLNIRSILKKQKNNPSAVKPLNSASLVWFFKSKLFIGILLVFIMAFLLNSLGFIPTSILFLCAYMYLLGEKKASKLLIISILTTTGLYVIFYAGLDIMLPRGIGIFRNIHMAIEGLF